MDEFSRVGEKGGSIFLPHTNIHSTQIGMLERAGTLKRRGEHQHGIFLQLIYNRNASVILFCFLMLLKISLLSYLAYKLTGVIAFSGMVMASISCLMFVESLVSPTTDRCTVFFWQRLTLYTKGGETWVISVLESRWKSSCRILRAIEK
jgi:hypothetical protein